MPPPPNPIPVQIDPENAARYTWDKQIWIFNTDDMCVFPESAVGQIVDAEFCWVTELEPEVVDPDATDTELTPKNGLVPEEQTCITQTIELTTEQQELTWTVSQP